MPTNTSPAERAAREILSNLRCEGYHIAPPSDMAVLKGAAMVRRAYAERDAKVLEALKKIAFDPRDPEDEPGDGSALHAAWEWKQIARAAISALEER